MAATECPRPSIARQHPLVNCTRRARNRGVSASHPIRRYRHAGSLPERSDKAASLEHLRQRYSAMALGLLKGAEKAAALERVKQHQAQMKAVAG